MASIIENFHYYVWVSFLFSMSELVFPHDAFILIGDFTIRQATVATLLLSG